MVRPGRERLPGAVEVDEAYWGGPEEGAVGRLTEDKALIAVAVAGPHREGEEPKPMMNGPEKSDPAIVAMKPAL